MNKQEWNELIRGLRDVESIDRMVAAPKTLHRIATKEDLPHLMLLLEDASYFVREAAAWPIAELAGASALPQLFKAHQRGFEEGHDNDGLSAALMQLAKENKADARLALQELIESGDEEIRKRAAWLLRFCSD